MASYERLVRADEVLNHSFPVTSFRPEYDQRQVDQLLDGVVATLRAYEQGGRLARMTTAHDVLSADFTATKFRAGYGMPAVDAFLDTLIPTLRHYEGGSDPAAQASVSERAPEVTENPPAISEWPQRGKGWWRRTR